MSTDTFQLERLVTDTDEFLADVRSRAALADVVVVDPDAGEHTAEWAIQDGRMVLTVDPETREELWR